MLKFCVWTHTSICNLRSTGNSPLFFNHIAPNSHIPRINKSLIALPVHHVIVKKSFTAETQIYTHCETILYIVHMLGAMARTRVAQMYVYGAFCGSICNNIDTRWRQRLQHSQRFQWNNRTLNSAVWIVDTKTIK